MGQVDPVRFRDQAETASRRRRSSTADPFRRSPAWLSGGRAVHWLLCRRESEVSSECFQASHWTLTTVANIGEMPLRRRWAGGLRVSCEAAASDVSIARRWRGALPAARADALLTARSSMRAGWAEFFINRFAHLANALLIAARDISKQNTHTKLKARTLNEVQTRAPTTRKTRSKYRRRITSISLAAFLVVGYALRLAK